MIQEQRSEIKPRDARAEGIIRKFEATLEKYLDGKEGMEFVFKVNISPQGGIGRCYLDTHTEIK